MNALKKEMGKDKIGLKMEASDNYLTDISKFKRKQMIDKWKSSSLITPLTTTHTFEISEIYYKKQEVYEKSFKNFCSRFEKIKQNGYGMFIHGRSGTGKTFYVDSIYNKLKNDFVVFRISYKLLLYILLTYYPKNKKKKEIKTLDYFLSLLKECELIIIDDIFPKKLSSWQLYAINELFEMIYENKKSFIISTIMKPEIFKKNFLTKEQLYMFDKMIEKAKVYAFDWKSYRSFIHTNKIINFF